jgi:hypothetical protein
MSFVIATLIWRRSRRLWFLAYSAPPFAPPALLTHVAAIAYAGVAGNVRLLQLLRVLHGGTNGLAGRVLLAWLAGNLLVGTQVSWIISPFIGSPHARCHSGIRSSDCEYAFERAVPSAVQSFERRNHSLIDRGNPPARSRRPQDRPLVVQLSHHRESLLKRPPLIVNLARSERPVVGVAVDWHHRRTTVYGMLTHSQGATTLGGTAEVHKGTVLAAIFCLPTLYDRLPERT